MRVVFVHGACVRDGPWWWHRSAGLLAEHGVVSLAPALPSCGEAGTAAGPQGPGLGDDVRAVRAVLQGSAEPTVVVAHSYGGIVAAEAAADVDAVQHMVLISSYLPEVGQSLSSFSGPAPAPFLDLDPDGGTFGVRPDMLVETFLQDCPAEIGAQATDHLARQSLSIIGEPVRAAAWQQLPSTYLVCTGTGAHRSRRSGNSPAGRGRSSNSTQGITRSSPDRTWSPNSCWDWLNRSAPPWVAARRSRRRPCTPRAHRH